MSNYNQSDINVITDNYQNKDYKGNYDSKGNKSGFGIQKMPDGSQFFGFFANNKANGWGIYQHKDGEIFKGEYEDERTSGYGEYKNINGTTYIGLMICNLV